jgi:hypothetical protein
MTARSDHLKPEGSAVEFDAVVRRVRAEFLEMPGLRVTVAQAARLWGLEATTCEAVIEALVHSHFLQRSTAGRVMRAA